MELLEAIEYNSKARQINKVSNCVVITAIVERSIHPPYEFLSELNKPTAELRMDMRKGRSRRVGPAPLLEQGFL